MRKVTKKELARKLQQQEARFDRLVSQLAIRGFDFNEPQKLKQLDRSVFDGLDVKWRFAAVDEDGDAWRYREKPKIDDGDKRWSSSKTVPLLIGRGYDTTNWQNSLIEREPKELTGSDLCRKMIERGDKYIMCLTSCVSDDNAILKGRVETVFYESESTRWNFETVDDLVIYAVPINNQGEPLTAKDVGL